MKSQKTKPNTEAFPFPFSTAKKSLKDAAPKLVNSGAGSRLGARELAYLYQPSKSGLQNSVSRSLDPGEHIHNDHNILPENSTWIDMVSERSKRFPQKISLCTTENSSGCSISTEQNNMIPHFLDSGNQSPASKESASSQAGDAQRSTAISKTAVVNSGSGYNTSPDDVLGMTDLKLFLEIRRTMAQQQEVFAVQIFELHRLTKVQRLIARCPEIIASVDKEFHSKPSLKGSAVDKKSQNISEPMSPLVKGNFDPQTPKQSAECPKRNASVELHAEPDYLKGHFSPRFLPGPCAVNQWLIPVRTPSEGVLYKPYIGPWPPPAGSLAPFYCSPSPDGVFMNMICAVPASDQLGNSMCTCFSALGQSYMHTCATPTAPCESSSAVEQNNPLITTCLSGRTHSLSSHTTDCTATSHQNSCTTISQKRATPSCRRRDIMDLKGSDHQGASCSPCEEVLGVFSLCPSTSTIQMPHQPVLRHIDEQPIQVIKALPYDPKMASESAARIFRSIQEERKRC